MTREQKALFAGLGLGLLLSFILYGMTAKAHTPCNDIYKQPDCHYVQVVNPITGELEQQYICE